MSEKAARPFCHCQPLGLQTSGGRAAKQMRSLPWCSHSTKSGNSKYRALRIRKFDAESSGPKENLKINQKRRKNSTKRESENSTKRESEKSTHRTPDRKGMRKLYLRADQPADYFTNSQLDCNQVLNSYHPSIHPCTHFTKMENQTQLKTKLG